MAQTAVSWLVNEIFGENGLILYAKQIEQAKAMEKEQIIDADLNATIRTAKGSNSDVSVRIVKKLAEQYYNETYNK